MPILLAVVEDEPQVFGAGAAGPGDGIGAAVLHDDTGEFLRGLGVGHDLRAGAELQAQRAGEHDRRQLVAKQDGDGVLVAGTELADDARHC